MANNLMALIVRFAPYVMVFVAIIAECLAMKIHIGGTFAAISAALLYTGGAYWLGRRHQENQ